MSAYTISIIAVTVASSLVVMIVSGTKYEKLIIAVASAVIAISAFTPVVRFFSSDFDGEVIEESKRIEHDISDSVEREFRDNLERNIKICIEEQFAGCRVVSVTADASTSRGVRRITVTESDADPDLIKEYIRDLVSCDDVKIIRISDND